MAASTKTRQILITIEIITTSYLLILNLVIVSVLTSEPYTDHLQTMFLQPVSDVSRQEWLPRMVEFDTEVAGLKQNALNLRKLDTGTVTKSTVISFLACGVPHNKVGLS